MLLFFHCHLLNQVSYLRLISLGVVAAVSANGEQNVGALEVGAELEEVRALPLLQPEHHEEGVQVSAILGAAIAHLEINDLLWPPWRYPA